MDPLGCHNDLRLCLSANKLLDLFFFFSWTFSQELRFMDRLDSLSAHKLEPALPLVRTVEHAQISFSIEAMRHGLGRTWRQLFLDAAVRNASLYKRVCPSVGPSVGPLRLCKNRVSRLFLATVRSYTETDDQPTCFESLFTRLFVHLSLYTYVAWSIHDETQPGRIFARSGLFICRRFF